MKIVNILSEYPCLLKSIQDLNQELNEIVRTREKLIATVIKDDTVSNSVWIKNASGSTMKAIEKIVDRYGSFIDYATGKINQLIESKETIDKSLKALNKDEYGVIELKYFRGYKMIKVMSLMKFSLQDCYKLHDNAIKKITAEIERDREIKKIAT